MPNYSNRPISRVDSEQRLSRSGRARGTSINRTRVDLRNCRMT